MNRTALLTHVARRLNDHSDLPGDDDLLHITDEHRAALFAVLEAEKSGKPEQLREALTECAQVHERYGLAGADWMREAAGEIHADLS